MKIWKIKKNEIKKNLSLHNVEYKEMANDGELSKFDNFSYKTILRKKRHTDNDSLILNFEDDDGM